MEDGLHVPGGRPHELAVADIADDDLELAAGLDAARALPLPVEALHHPLEIAQRARGEVVENADGYPLLEQALDEVRAHESSAACDEDRAHGSSPRG